MSFTPRHTDLVSLVQAATKAHAARPLFGVEKGERWEWLTYGDFGKLVAQLRGGLASLGVTSGDRVAVISNNRVPWAVGACATHSLGAVYVPMYEVQLEKDWQYILRDSGAKVCLAATPEIAKKLRGAKAELPKLERVICLEAPAASVAS